MKKRVGLFGLMLTAVGLMLQPAIAGAAGFDHGQHARVEQQRDVRNVRYSEPVQYRDRAVRRDDRDHGRRVVIVRRDDCRVSR